MVAAGPESIARGIIDSVAYMVLGSADVTGRPWTSPVWFAHEGYREFFWVSIPTSRHSRNIAARSDVSIVVFDSGVPVGEGQAVYMTGVAERLAGTELERGIAIFGQASHGQGTREWTIDVVLPPAPYRLYRATASEQWILAPEGHPDYDLPGDNRIPVSL